MKQVNIAKTCIGCGLCLQHGKYIKEMVDGNAEAISGKFVDDKDIAELMKTIEICPAKAITLQEWLPQKDKRAEKQRIVEKLKHYKNSFSMSAGNLKEFSESEVRSYIDWCYVGGGDLLKNNFTTSKSKLKNEIESIFDRKYYDEKARITILRKLLAEFKIRNLSPYYTKPDEEHSAYYKSNKELTDLLRTVYSQWNQLVENYERLPEEWLQFSVLTEGDTFELEHFENCSSSSRVQREAFDSLSSRSSYLNMIEYEKTMNTNGLFQKSNSEHYVLNMDYMTREFIDDFARGLKWAVNYESNYKEKVNRVINRYVENVKKMLDKKISALKI